MKMAYLKCTGRRLLVSQNPVYLSIAVRAYRVAVWAWYRASTVPVPHGTVRYRHGTWLTRGTHKIVSTCAVGCNGKYRNGTVAVPLRYSPLWHRDGHAHVHACCLGPGGCPGASHRASGWLMRCLTRPSRLQVREARPMHCVEHTSQLGKFVARCLGGHVACELSGAPRAPPRR